MNTSPPSHGQDWYNCAVAKSLDIDTSRWADYASDYERNLNGRLTSIGCIGLAPLGLIVWALI